MSAQYSIWQTLTGQDRVLETQRYQRELEEKKKKWVEMMKGVSKVGRLAREEDIRKGVPTESFQGGNMASAGVPTTQMGNPQEKNHVQTSIQPQVYPSNDPEPQHQHIPPPRDTITGSNNDPQNHIPNQIKNLVDPHGVVSGWANGAYGPLTGMVGNFTNPDARYPVWNPTHGGWLGYMWDILVFTGGYVVYTYEDLVTEWRNWDGHWYTIMEPYRLWRTVVSAGVTVALMYSIPLLESLLSILGWMVRAIVEAFQLGEQGVQILTNAAERLWYDWLVLYDWMMRTWNRRLE